MQLLKLLKREKTYENKSKLGKLYPVELTEDVAEELDGSVVRFVQEGRVVKKSNI